MRCEVDIEETEEKWGGKGICQNLGSTVGAAERGCYFLCYFLLLSAILGSSATPIV